MDDEIKVENLDGEIRIDLPVRQSKDLHRFGRIVVAAGFSVVALFHILAPPARLADAIIATAINPALIVVYLGVCFLTDKTSCRLRWNNNSLETVEYFGWLKWTRSCHSAGIQNFVYSSILNEFTQDIKRLMPEGLENLSLNLEYHDAPHTLVYWYPRSILEELASEIIAELESRATSQSAIVSTDEIEANEPIENGIVSEREDFKIGVLEQAEHDLIIRKPAGSRVQLEKHDQAIVFKIPPKGFWKANGDLAKFCAVVLFLIGFQTLIYYGSIFQGNTAWWKVVYPIPWWVIGFGLWAYCYREGRAAVTIGASDDLLWVDQTVGLSGNKITEFERSDLNRITTKLDILDSFGKSHPTSTTLTGHEMEWIAYELNTYLKTGRFVRTEFL